MRFPVTTWHKQTIEKKINKSVTSNQQINFSPGSDTLGANGMIVFLNAPKEIDGDVFADVGGCVDASGDSLVRSKITNDVIFVADDRIDIHFIVTLILQNRLTQ